MIHTHKIDSVSLRKKVSGIYMIKNLINQRTYVGRSHDIPARFAIHIDKLLHGGHSNKNLVTDFNKFGIHNFSFQILEVVDYGTKNLNAYLTSLEEKYVLEYDAMYPKGYCERVGNLNFSDTRLLTDRIVCYDLRTDEVKYAEVFGEAGLIVGITAGAVKKAVNSSSNYKQHHLFFFESDYQKMDAEIFEKKRKSGKRYSSSTK